MCCNNYFEYKSNSYRNKALSIVEYLKEIKQYLKDFVNYVKKSDKWKIQLILTISYISSKGIDKEQVMHSKSDSIEIMINEKADEVIEEPFEWLFSRYQIGLETLIRGSDFIFNFTDSLYYKCHKINLSRSGSYIPNWQILVLKTSRGRPPPASPRHPLNILFEHPREVPI